MKMIFAIVRKEDEGFVIERLNKEKISVTKLSSTGGFLRKGNATLMIGTEAERQHNCGFFGIGCRIFGAAIGQRRAAQPTGNLAAGYLRTKKYPQVYRHGAE